MTAGWKGIGKRAFIMLADSEGDRDAWISAIRAAARALNVNYWAYHFH